jgi:hypothetical protein
MATAKKKPATKKPSTSKTPAKTRAKSAPKKQKVVKMESFKVAPQAPPFFTFRVTRQTLYWVVISLLIMSLFFWVLSIQLEILRIIDAK